MPIYKVFADTKGSVELINRRWSWFGFFWYIWIFNGVVNPWTLGAAGVCILGGVTIGLLDLSGDTALTLYFVATVMVNIAMGLVWPRLLSRDFEKSGFRLICSMKADSRTTAERQYNKEKSMLGVSVEQSPSKELLD